MDEEAENVNSVDLVRWGVNSAVATCRHVLGDDRLPVCGQSRGHFEDLEQVVATTAGDPDKIRAALTALPICARCKPIARMRGVSV